MPRNFAVTINRISKVVEVATLHVKADSAAGAAEIARYELRALDADVLQWDEAAREIVDVRFLASLADKPGPADA